jgi:hypothetical protein
MKNKNIHILPIDKPSRLLKTIPKGNLILSKSVTSGSHWENQNIYITSDEEIKEGDYVYDSSENDVIKRSNFPDINGYIKRFCKKIILTTDQDLIKDGVQAIDDEFLEWFVKNPSCEEVEVKSFKSYSKDNYIMFIPHEEPKQQAIEEAAEKYSKGWGEYDDEKYFIEGVKWQQQQNKNLYSLDDLKEAFAMGRTNATIKDFNTKFKKK